MGHPLITSQGKRRVFQWPDDFLIASYRVSGIVMLLIIDCWLVVSQDNELAGLYPAVVQFG